MHYNDMNSLEKNFSARLFKSSITASTSINAKGNPEYIKEGDHAD